MSGEPGRWVASFYRFQPLANIGALRQSLEDACAARGLTGTVLLAPEGINAALAGSRPSVESVLREFFPACEPMWTPAPPGTVVFKRMRVRERGEIVTCGRGLSPATPIGRHVAAAEWNALVADPEVLVLDVRNEYESAIGAFRGAIPAATANFGEFPAFADNALASNRDQPVAMYCTGGIRCEKASAHLLERGWRSVYQLRGGILRYLAETPPQDNAFEGECFVFDGRISLGRDLREGGYRPCRKCGRPVCKDAQGDCAACAAAVAARSGGGHADVNAGGARPTPTVA